jgi:hypothetical protein
MAVRHSIWQSAELKINLMYSGISEVSTCEMGYIGWDGGELRCCSSALRPEAEEFTPVESFVEVDWPSMQFQVNELSDCNRLTSSVLESPDMICTRKGKGIREPLLTDSLPMETHAQLRRTLSGIDGQVILE